MGCLQQSAAVLFYQFALSQDQEISVIGESIVKNKVTCEFTG